MLDESSLHVPPFSAVTLREIVHVSAGGDRVRLRFKNEIDTDPLTISDAHVAFGTGGVGIQPEAITRLDSMAQPA